LGRLNLRHAHFNTEVTELFSMFSVLSVSSVLEPSSLNIRLSPDHFISHA
jgi:hypothetical protein